MPPSFVHWRLPKTQPTRLIQDESEGYPEIELPEIELPEIELPEIELPEIELPEIELPEIELPEIELPEIELNVEEHLWVPSAASV